jgi:hypothetical protein
MSGLHAAAAPPACAAGTRRPRAARGARASLAGDSARAQCRAGTTTPRFLHSGPARAPPPAPLLPLRRGAACRAAAAPARASGAVLASSRASPFASATPRATSSLLLSGTHLAPLRRARRARWSAAPCAAASPPPRGGVPPAAAAAAAAAVAPSAPPAAASPASPAPPPPGPPLGAPLPEHPLLRRGTLPNGLRYVVLPNAVPPNRFEAHLEMHAGSVDEGEAEQGVAHLVEHVVFLGSRKREKLLGARAARRAARTRTTPLSGGEKPQRARAAPAPPRAHF